MTRVRPFHRRCLIVAFGLLMGVGGDAIAASPDFTENTACTAVVEALNAKDEGKMGAIAGVTLMVMQAIDPDWVEKLPQTEKWRGKELALIVVTTGVACEDHPGWTLGEAVGETYKKLLAIAALRNQH
jgi:hypothetical protein